MEASSGDLKVSAFKGTCPASFMIANCVRFVREGQILSLKIFK